MDRHFYYLFNPFVLVYKAFAFCIYLYKHEHFVNIMRIQSTHSSSICL